MSEQKKWIRLVPWVAGAVGLAVVVGVVLWVKSLIPADDVKPKKMVQQITVITPPPPPPPEVKPPEPEEPEIKDEEIPQETPEEPMPEAAEDTPAGDDLGVDAEGGAGGDAFGLVGRKGGRGLLAGGSGGYTSKVQRAISDLITEDKKLRRLEYAAVLKLWINETGAIDRYDVSIANGDADARQYLELALAKTGVRLDVPPKEMAQPIKIRIRSKL